MSFNIKEIGGYGNSPCDDVEISDGVFDNVNSYARVWKIDELDDNKIHIDTDTMILSDYSNFSAGQEILLHVSASPIDTDFLGNYLVAKVLLSQYGVLTLDKDVTQIIPRDELVKYYVQVVSIAQFDCLKIKKDGIITPSPYNPYNYIGGILAIKCWDALQLDGGHIDLADKGLPANRKHLLRPLTLQETAARGESDVAR